MAPDRTARGDVLICRYATAPCPPPPPHDDTASVARHGIVRDEPFAEPHDEFAPPALAKAASSRHVSARQLASAGRRRPACALLLTVRMPRHWDALDGGPHVTGPTPRRGARPNRDSGGVAEGRSATAPEARFGARDLLISHELTFRAPPRPLSLVRSSRPLFLASLPFISVELTVALGADIAGGVGPRPVQNMVNRLCLCVVLL